MTLQERLFSVFGKPQRGLITEISLLCKVSKPTVSNWFNKPEKVATISRTHAELICKAYKLDVRPAWLSEGIKPRLATGENALPTTDAPEVQTVTDGPEARGPYPLISEVQAGGWTELCDNFQPGEADEWYTSAKSLGKCGYMLRVKGKSMYAPGQKHSFQEGMILHVNPDLEPVPGQFVIVRRESSKEATFKRYVLIEGSPYLEAINPDWPRDEKYLKLQKGDVWCGVVVDASVGDLP